MGLAEPKRICERKKKERCFSLDIALHERMRFDVLFQSISCGFYANRIMNSRQYTVQLSFLHCSPRFVENSHKTFNSVYQQTQDQISVWIEREYRAPNRFAARLRRNPSPLWSFADARRGCKPPLRSEQQIQTTLPFAFSNLHFKNRRDNHDLHNLRSVWNSAFSNSNC